MTNSQSQGSRVELSQIHPQPLSEQIRDMLRDRIISGDLSPGERLTETELANRLAVSRGPLREAVLQLTEDGLLVKTAYKGLRVRSVSQSELCELYSMRTTLEGFAFEEAWEKRSDNDFAELRRRYASLEASRQAGDYVQSVQGEIAFHSWIYELSGHSILQSHWQRLVPLVQIYMSIHQKRHGVSGVFMAANHEYVRLASEHDLNDMRDHIAEHMQKGLAEVQEDLVDDQSSKI